MKTNTIMVMILVNRISHRDTTFLIKQHSPGYLRRPTNCGPPAQVGFLKQHKIRAQFHPHKASVRGYFGELNIFIL